MNIWHVFVISCLISLIISTVSAQEPVPFNNPTKNNTPSDAYKLVWSDEFNEDGKPDISKWSYEHGFARNEELQWYQPNNARCENGLLIIEARRERKQNPRYNPDSKNWRENREYTEYTSASITTIGLHSWTYGRFEMRARIDTRPGLWPAFWTVGASAEWPKGGEIDIMEFYKDTLLANVAWAKKERWQAKWDDLKKPLTEFNDPEWSKKFHVWRMDWDENSIKIYVDDLLLKSTDLNNTFNEDAEGKNPFRYPQSQHIILNLAVGGTNGGNPSNTEFPAKFEVDYVRIYQKQ